MSQKCRPWKCLCLLVALGTAPLAAQELTVIGGTFVSKRIYTWQVDYRHDFFRNAAASITYINEGHPVGHHRDGVAVEVWGNLPLYNDRLALSLGVGVYSYFDTQPVPLGGTVNEHGTAPVFSFSATGYFSNRFFYRIMVNRISPRDDVKSTTAGFGVGYWFGENRRPLGAEPGRGNPAAEPYTTEPQFTVFGGQSVVNTFLSQKALAGAVEYRQGILPHLDGTVSFIHEGDPKIARRLGMGLQAWGVNTFFNESIYVGIGVGVYAYIDRRHPATASDAINVVGLDSPAALAPLVSLSVAKKISTNLIVRLVFDRVVSNYNRDSDVFLAGLGYCWRLSELPVRADGPHSLAQAPGFVRLCMTRSRWLRQP